MTNWFERPTVDLEPEVIAAIRAGCLALGIEADVMDSIVLAKPDGWSGTPIEWVRMSVAMALAERDGCGLSDEDVCGGEEIVKGARFIREAKLGFARRRARRN